LPWFPSASFFSLADILLPVDLYFIHIQP